MMANEDIIIPMIDGPPFHTSLESIRTLEFMPSDQTLLIQAADLLATTLFKLLLKATRRLKHTEDDKKLAGYYAESFIYREQRRAVPILADTNYKAFLEFAAS